MTHTTPRQRGHVYVSAVYREASRDWQVAVRWCSERPHDIDRTLEEQTLRFRMDAFAYALECGSYYGTEDIRGVFPHMPPRAIKQRE